MIRLIIRFALLVALAGGFAWLADRPGVLRIDWLDYRIEAPLAVAVALIFLAFILSLWLFGLVRRSWRAPGAVAGIIRKRKNRMAYDALSRGIIAIGAGDLETARRNAQLASRVLREEPLAKLLEAQTAQLSGDSKRVTALFETMAEKPETKLLGLRGLFNQARQSGDSGRAGRIAAEALKSNPGLTWASNAMLMIQSSEKNWRGAAETIESQRRSRVIDETTANRQRAVVLTAQALEREKNAPGEAVQLAVKAHKLDPAMVPAALVAARIFSSQRRIRKAAQILERTYSLHPHVDLVRLYSFLKAGASPRERLKRAEDLVARQGGGEEGAVGISEAAIAALDLTRAKSALEPFINDRPRARVCGLFADIAEKEGDKGLAREWLARGMRAPADPKWTADGVTSERWQPISPVTGQLGAFQWKVPVERLAYESVEGTVGAPTAVESPEAEIEPQALSEDAEEPLDQGNKAAPPAAGNERTVAVPENADESHGNREASSSQPASFPLPDDPGPQTDENPFGPEDWTSRVARSS